MAVLRPKGAAGPGEGEGEAAAIVGQRVGEAEGEGGRTLVEERDGAPLGLVVLDREVDGARAPVDGNVEEALAPLAVGGLQLGQVLILAAFAATAAYASCSPTKARRRAPLSVGTLLRVQPVTRTATCCPAGTTPVYS